jgi:hypothetical protein
MQVPLIVHDQAVAKLEEAHVLAKVKISQRTFIHETLLADGADPGLQVSLSISQGVASGEGGPTDTARVPQADSEELLLRDRAQADMHMIKMLQVAIAGPRVPRGLAPIPSRVLSLVSYTPIV